MSSRLPGQKIGGSIAVVTNNEHGTKPLIETLTREAFAVYLLTSKEDMFNRHVLNDPDLLIIDSHRFSLEETSSYPRLRTVYSGLLMLLTDGIDEMMQVLLYEQGVDDLLVKPMHHLLMLARIRALLRRNNQRTIPSTLLFNGLEINSGLRRATFCDEEIPLTAREFDLLSHLAQNAYSTLDRDHLYKAVFGIEYNGYDRSIDMYIARIRAKMAKFPNLAHMIKTVRGSGYLFAGA